MLKAKGFTIAEVVVVLAIVAILFAVTSPSIGRAMQNSNIDQTTEKIRTIVSDIEMCLIERDIPQPVVGENIQDTVKAFLNDYNANYASILFDVSTLEVKANSFTVKTLISVDAWGTPFLLYYTWTNEMFIVASAGPDMKIDFLTEKDVAGVDDILGAAIIKR